MNDVLKAEGRYADAELEVEDGHFIYYFPTGRRKAKETTPWATRAVFGSAMMNGAAARGEGL